MLKTSRAVRGILIATALALPAAALTVLPAWAATQVSTWPDLLAAFNGVSAGQSATIQLNATITAQTGGYLTVNNNSGSGGANITLDLHGHTLNINNSVTANYAPISVGKGASLTINDSSNGSGQLNATAGLSSNAAGIGGYSAGTSSSDAGNIIINGGVIQATGYYGAGIGGYANGGSVTINGGTITANTDSYGAGIGGGYISGAGGLITITGGTVTPTGYYGAGIGGGYNGATGTVVISGGTVNATGNHGAGIGNGYEATSSVTSFGSVTISGGNVNAESQDFGAGIGGGDDNYTGGMPSISISGGTVVALGENGAGIGLGYYSTVPSGATITLSGGAITATGDGGSAGIGASYGSGVPTPPIAFTGCVPSLTANGGPDHNGPGGGAGLGGAVNSSPYNDGGTVSVKGTMTSGSSTSGGNGATGGGSGYEPGLGSTLTFDGTSGYLVTTSSTTGVAGSGAGGTFTMSCVAQVPSSLTLTPGFAVGSLAANAPLTVSGQHLLASSAWTATIQSTPVVFASGITSGSGSFTQAANLPGNVLPGAHIITLAGTNFASGRISQVLYITVDATGHISYLSTSGPQANTGSQSGSGGSSLAETGFNAALGVSAIIVLIAAGGVLLLLARRRNTQH